VSTEQPVAAIVADLVEQAIAALMGRNRIASPAARLPSGTG
jgi:hypothetical protein